jgi:hypothetical protein
VQSSLIACLYYKVWDMIYGYDHSILLITYDYGLIIYLN